MKKNIMMFLAIPLFLSFFLDTYISEMTVKLRNPILDPIMVWFSHEITVFVVLVIMCALFLYEERKNKYIAPLFISFFTAVFISFIIKLMVMRLRPIGETYFALNLLGTAFNIPDYSFPSVHSAMAFCVLPILDKEFKKLKLFWIFFAVMIALSRIYLNQHYLSDCIAGGIIGYFTGAYILKLGEKHEIHKAIFHHV
jgi:undecaprenyl-diphosphatase